MCVGSNKCSIHADPRVFVVWAVNQYCMRTSRCRLYISRDNNVTFCLVVGAVVGSVLGTQRVHLGHLQMIHIANGQYDCCVFLELRIVSNVAIHVNVRNLNF